MKKRKKEIMLPIGDSMIALSFFVARPATEAQTIVEPASVMPPEKTSLYLQKEAKPRYRRVIVVIPDGEGTYGEKYLTVNQTTTGQQRSDTLFYSINSSGSTVRLNQVGLRGQDTVRQMAAAQNRFVPIRVEIPKSPGLRIRARQGYYLQS